MNACGLLANAIEPAAGDSVASFHVSSYTNDLRACPVFLTIGVVLFMLNPSFGLFWLPLGAKVAHLGHFPCPIAGAEGWDAMGDDEM